MQARTVLFISIVFCSAGLLLARFSTQVLMSLRLILLTCKKTPLKHHYYIGMALVFKWCSLWHRFINHVLCKYIVTTTIQFFTLYSYISFTRRLRLVYFMFYKLRVSKKKANVKNAEKKRSFFMEERELNFTFSI
jgi:hypothetical protein